VIKVACFEFNSKRTSYQNGTIFNSVQFVRFSFSTVIYCRLSTHHKIEYIITENGSVYVLFYFLTRCRLFIYRRRVFFLFVLNPSQFDHLKLSYTLANYFHACLFSIETNYAKLSFVFFSIVYLMFCFFS